MSVKAVTTATLLRRTGIAPTRAAAAALTAANVGFTFLYYASLVGLMLGPTRRMLVGRVRLVGDPTSVALVTAGAPVVGCAVHLGLFEVAAAHLADRFSLRYDVPVSRVSVRARQWAMCRIRRSCGLRTHEVGGTLQVLEAALSSNRPVITMLDRRPVRAGINVEFFGQRALVPSTPVHLAAASGHPIIPVATYVRNGYIEIWLGSPITVSTGRDTDTDTAATKEILRHHESAIRKVPSQWHVPNDRRQILVELSKRSRPRGRPEYDESPSLYGANMR